MRIDRADADCRGCGERRRFTEVARLNNFLGIDIGSHPWNLLTDALAAASIGGIILAILIPVLAGVTQFISVKLSQMNTTMHLHRIRTTR